MHVLKLVLLSLLVLLPSSAAAVRPFILVITSDDYAKPLPGSSTLANDGDPADRGDASETDSDDWDDFPDASDSEESNHLDAGSWIPALDYPLLPSSYRNASGGEPDPDQRESVFVRSLFGMLSAAAASYDPEAFSEASAGIEAASAEGHAGAQSTVGFLQTYGILRPRSSAKSFLFHSFAAQGGVPQSKMVLAYSFFQQEMYEKSTPLYAELAEMALKSFLISKDPPVMEPVRLHAGTEENKEALRKSRGEDDDDFQITEYQAQRGNFQAMYKLGLLYYYGLWGLRRDNRKAYNWFLKAVEKGDTRSMELLGEMYARGAGVEKNYTKAFEWLSLAAKHKYYSAYNGLGYLYVKGYGVESKNLTKAKEYFEVAAEHKEPGGHYNLGVLYLKGLGVKRDVPAACNLFLLAANAGQPKALYQVAKLFQKGIGLKKNLHMASLLYKTVAERGPWSSLSRWALESYLKGDVGKALLLYLRMAELGYEVGQSNAAWILDKFGDQSGCFGVSGICTDNERHLRTHSLWWQASAQGNEHAALLIGDAYYYGQGIERDFERAAEAYMHAQSQNNPQAMFNLGYMHEHGEGLPLDFHLAKRYYDQALEVDSSSKLPITLALASLWLRMNHPGSFMVNMIDALPELYPRVEEWVENLLMDEGNSTILTLFACLLAVLYLRERQRRQAIAAAAGPPQEPGE